MAKGNSLEYTPTWAVSIFALFFFLLSFLIEAGLHCLTKLLRRRKRKSLNRALEKSKLEMMKLGLISLLLTVSEVPISKICISHSVANSFLPCEDPLESVEPAVASATQTSPPYSDDRPIDDDDDDDQNYCESMGMVSLMSREGILQLNIFISVLAVFHVLYCLITMFLGMAKMKRWKAWENETRTLEYQILNDPMRFQFSDQTTFGKRHLKFWSKYPFLLGPVSRMFVWFGNSVAQQSQKLTTSLFEMVSLLPTLPKPGTSTSRNFLPELTTMILSRLLESDFGSGSSAFCSYSSARTCFTTITG